MNATNIQRLKWRLSQSLHWLWRFRSLPRAERLFDSVAPGTILARRLFGYTFYGDVARSSIQRLIYLDGKRFIPEASLIRSFLKPGFHVIDVGANIGYYTLLLASAIGENGSIVAIEPSPENLRELYLNVERNNLTSKVEVVEAAVGDKAAVVGLRTGINSGVTDGDKAAYQVPMDTIDNIVKRHVDFMKIDIEGHEYDTLTALVCRRYTCPCLPIVWTRKSSSWPSSMASQSLKMQHCALSRCLARLMNARPAWLKSFRSSRTGELIRREP